MELAGEGVDGAIDSIQIHNCHIPRIKATPPWTAYVKIAEGCNNRCSYCLIPKIRGKLRLRKMTDILKEVEGLAKRGVKEIIYVAQDTTAYPDFAGLLKRTAKIRGLRWIRILYAHPAHLTDKVIKTIARERKIVKYIDLPIQHACDKILKRMRRRYARRDIEALILKIRRRNIALRSTVIVGFPGERRAEFEELLDFIKKAKFQKLGSFAYQREKGTPAYKMRGQVSEKVKRERVKRMMRVQSRVSGELNQKMIGKILEVLIERAVRGGFVGRSAMDAPDIDGSVLVKSNHVLKPGEIVRVRVAGAKTHDLVGCVT
jgi:ribosomal protein S12 methylthiotransferase